MPSRDRTAVACGAAVVWFTLSLAMQHIGLLTRTDLDIVVYGAKAMLQGIDPYPLVGPGRAFESMFPLYYPGPALIALAPLGWMPLMIARAAFSAVSAGLLAFALTRTGAFGLLVFLSEPVQNSILGGQWSPLLTVAIMVPGWSWIAAAKPNFALPIILANPTRRVLLYLFGGAALLLSISLALVPSWPMSWWVDMKEARHFYVPLLNPWLGAFLLITLLRWRRWEARALIAVAAVPQTMLGYNLVPLFVVPQKRNEMLLLVALSWCSAAGQLWLLINDPLPGMRISLAMAVPILMTFLPATYMILQRPNVWTSPDGGTVPYVRVDGPSSDIATSPVEHRRM